VVSSSAAVVLVELFTWNSLLGLLLPGDRSVPLHCNPGSVTIGADCLDFDPVRSGGDSRQIGPGVRWLLASCFAFLIFSFQILDFGFQILDFLF